MTFFIQKSPSTTSKYREWHPHHTMYRGCSVKRCSFGTLRPLIFKNTFHFIFCSTKKFQDTRFQLVEPRNYTPEPLQNAKSANILTRVRCKLHYHLFEGSTLHLGHTVYIWWIFHVHTRHQTFPKCRRFLGRFSTKSS